MQKKLLLFLVALLFLTDIELAGQQSEFRHVVDSVSKLLKTDRADTTKVIHLNKIASRYSYLYIFDSAMHFVNEALHLNEELMQKVKGESEATKQIRYALTKSKAYSYSIKGGAYYEHGNYPEALKCHFNSLKLYETLQNKRGIGAAYTNIGLIYYFQGNFDAAIKNHRASLQIDEAQGDKSGIATAYNNLGIVYSDQGNLQEALKSHQASLKIKKELGDKAGLAASYNNLGRLNYKLGSYTEAQKNNEACLRLYEELRDNEGMALAYFNMGDVFIKQKNLPAAEENLIKARELSKEINYRANLKYIYESLASLYKIKKDYRAAYANHKLFILYRDSISNEDTRRQSIETQMTYDFEKKEAVAEVEHQQELKNQKLLAEEKNRKQRIIMWCVVLGLVLVMGFAGFVFRSLKLAKAQKNIIESQKHEVEKQKHLVEEKQKEIIDSITYAKRLQKAILPSAEEMKKYLPDSFVLYQPKDIVAGDFYWMHVTDDLVFVAAADSTGHGVPGAMVSVVCSNALNRAVDEFRLTDTGKILDKTRELVLETFAKSGEAINDGMDISLLRIDKVKKQITWSGANNRLWYIDGAKRDTVTEIKANKQPIGKTDDPKPFTTHFIEMNTGAIFYLMTDGYPDQFGGPNGKKFKYKALEEKLVKIAHLSLSDQHKELVNAFLMWKGELEQVDDVTIIGIKVEA